jgi:hypothetical protein
MAAGVAANATAIEFLVEVALAHSLVDDLAKSRHQSPLEIFYADGGEGEDAPSTSSGQALATAGKMPALQGAEPTSG